jgi:AcrR family transcriptional regulator
MGYRHDRDDMLRAAVEVAMAEGVGAVTFGRVGKALGISDRTVVYYFATKKELLTAVVTHLGAQLQGVLEGAFGPDPLPVDELMRRAWPALTTSENDGVFALFFEVIGLAAAKQPPYDELVPQFLDGWIDWLAARVDAGSPELRHRQAASVVAQIDGLLLLRQISGAAIADDAAIELGVTRP